ncbi:MAG TPA: DUF417 family protein [Thermoanaerobaculia bacterium]|jgi:uncharacterized membrane protein YkgB|nr:DUF417 family protein [Thermoanaerobaculia bacterium]
MTHTAHAHSSADPLTPASSAISSTALRCQLRRSRIVDGIAHAGLAIARYGVAIVLFEIGLLKFTSAEATGIGALVTSSPLLHWMYAVWSMQGTSNVIGAIEIVAAIGIALRPISARAAAVGSALAVCTFLVTLSFFLTAPGIWDASLGFPFLGGSGQFIVKDVVLLGAALWSLGDALGTRTTSAVYNA